MKRLRETFSSVLLQAIELEEDGAPRRFPEQSTRGDEDQCARCGLDTGSVPDNEGRLMCVECGDRLGLIRYE